MLLLVCLPFLFLFVCLFVCLSASSNKITTQLNAAHSDKQTGNVVLKDLERKNCFLTYQHIIKFEELSRMD